MDDKVLSKVKKLLALAADDPSSPESQSAANKAAKLMVDNHLGFEDVNKATGKIEGAMMEEVRTSANMPHHQAWEALLSQVLCEVFSCHCFKETWPGGTTKRIFFGAKSDTTLAVWMFKYLRIKIAKESEEKFKLKRDQKTFGIGCVTTLSTRLLNMYKTKKAMEEQMSSALVVVGKDLAVKKNFESKYPNLKHKTYSKASGSRSSLEEGKRSGNAMGINRQVK